MYRVTWEIDIEADSPHEAALKARQCQMPGTTAVVFDTFNTETGAEVQVDLLGETPADALGGDQG